MRKPTEAASVLQNTCGVRGIAPFGHVAARMFPCGLGFKWPVWLPRATQQACWGVPWPRHRRCMPLQAQARSLPLALVATV